MNSKTFQKRVNQTLGEIIKEAVLTEFYNEPVDLGNKGVEISTRVNDSIVYFFDPERRAEDQFRFICKFDPDRSKPKDIAKFILFGLTQNHIIDVDIRNRKRFFRIDEVYFVGSAHILEVRINEVVGLETGALPSGQKVYKPIIPGEY